MFFPYPGWILSGWCYKIITKHYDLWSRYLSTSILIAFITTNEAGDGNPTTDRVFTESPITTDIPGITSQPAEQTTAGKFFLWENMGELIPP